MSPDPQTPCRTPGCPAGVPQLLRIEALCPEHFIEHAFTCAASALDRLERSAPVEQRDVDWLMSDAAFIARDLTQRADSLPTVHRDRLLELLLCLTNLHEYLRHHSVALRPAS